MVSPVLITASASITVDFFRMSKFSLMKLLLQSFIFQRLSCFSSKNNSEQSKTSAIPSPKGSPERRRHTTANLFSFGLSVMISFPII